MTERIRHALTDRDQAELWRRWREGASLTEIAHALARRHTTIHSAVARCGGIAPRRRRRAARQLSLVERTRILRGLAAGQTASQIAQDLGRTPSTISRELTRNGGRQHYCAVQADQAAWARATRPKPCVLAQRPRLRQMVADKLSRCWSPQQIARWLERAYPDDDTMRVSHETIYRSLFIQTRGVLKKQLLAQLRSQRSRRHPKRLNAQAARPGQIVDALSIRQRPAQIEDRALPGHWEGDLLCGGHHTQLATLVERHSRFVMLVKVPSKETATVVKALTRQVRKLPHQLRGSLTWDRGPELADHQRFTLATRMQVYFCDPRSPWQRGTNENTNGLLRQYFPKGKPVSEYSQAQLNRVARELNQRPRKTLGYRTPADVLNTYLATTG